jgi:phage tail-like protein
MTATLLPLERDSRSLSAGVPTGLLAHDFGRRLVGGFDDLLEPFFAVLDQFDAYLDPRLAPDAFVPWLAEWLAFSVREGTSVAELRQRFPHALEAIRWVGTRRGIAAAVRAYTGLVVDVEDNGGVAWAIKPGEPLPGQSTPSLRILMPPPPTDSEQRDLVDRVVTSMKPAHLPHLLVGP